MRRTIEINCALLATRPEVLTPVLGIVYRMISGHLIRKASLTRRCANIGAVTLIQRFGSALNLNIHFHMLFLDGVYDTGRSGLARAQVAPVMRTAESGSDLHRVPPAQRSLSAVLSSAVVHAPPSIGSRPAPMPSFSVVRRSTVMR